MEGGDLRRAVDDAGVDDRRAEFEHLLRFKSSKNQFISDTVSVAVRDGHANHFVVHCIVIFGVLWDLWG